MPPECHDWCGVLCTGVCMTLTRGSDHVIEDCHVPTRAATRMNRHPRRTLATMAATRMSGHHSRRSKRNEAPIQDAPDTRDGHVAGCSRPDCMQDVPWTLMQQCTRGPCIHAIASTCSCTDVRGLRAHTHSNQKHTSTNISHRGMRRPCDRGTVGQHGAFRQP